MAKQRKLPRGIDLYRGGYRARISVDGFQHHLGWYPTLGDAKTALTIAWGQKAAGTFVPPAEKRRMMRELRAKERERAVTVRQWVETWLESIATDPEEPRSPGTITAYRSTLRAHVLDYIGDEPLTDVTEEQIAAVVDGARKAGPYAAHSTARTLHTLFNAAVQISAGGLTDSPVKVKTTRPKFRRDLEDEEDRTATPAEVHAFAAGMPEPLRLSVYLAAWLALRQGEVLGTQRGDFRDLDGERPRLLIRRQWHSKANPPAYTEPKSDSGRRVFLPPKLVPLVTEHLERHVSSEVDAPLFPSSRKPTVPVSQSTFDRYWRLARDPVRPGFRFHALRHTALTAWAQTGATLRDVMEYGGHRDVNVAMRYQDSTQDRQWEQTMKLNEQIGPEA